MKNIALITGASSGIGKEMARIHAANGGDLIIVARSKEKLDALKEELETKYSIEVLVIVKDLGVAGSPQEVYTEVREAGLSLDYLVNNAGFGGIGHFAEQSMVLQLSMIRLNIEALTALTRLFLADFKQRNTGRILNVSSTASLMPGPLQAVYFATKAYVTSFSNALVEELRGTNVTVTNLMPGATETEFGSISGMDKTEMFKQTTSARKVAEDGYKAMLKGQMNVISGLTFVQKILMAFMPFMPKRMVLKMVREMQEVK